MKQTLQHFKCIAPSRYHSAKNPYRKLQARLWGLPAISRMTGVSCLFRCKDDLPQFMYRMLEPHVPPTKTTCVSKKLIVDHDLGNVLAWYKSELYERWRNGCNIQGLECAKFCPQSSNCAWPRYNTIILDHLSRCDALQCPCAAPMVGFQFPGERASMALCMTQRVFIP